MGPNATPHGEIGTLDNLLQLGDQAHLIKWTGGPGYPQKLYSSCLELLSAAKNSRRHLVTLSTSRPSELAKIFFDGGINALLDPSAQKVPEKTATDLGASFPWLGELAPAIDSIELFPGSSVPVLSGSNAVYDWELFFHLPFSIAHYLNSQGKFAEAEAFYEYIFDPTAPTEPGQSAKTENVWRFLEFRNRDIPKLSQILTDEAAIAVYKREPFDPFAVARLRPSAFQKAVVMRYIDNLLDWGDTLFGRDTMESLNEATMLYVMAADILGDRPQEVGECATFPEDMLTYFQISLQHAGADFLIELENISDSFGQLTWVTWGTSKAEPTSTPVSWPNLSRGVRRVPEGTSYGDVEELASAFVLRPSHSRCVQPVPEGLTRGAGFAVLGQRANETFAPFNTVKAWRSPLTTGGGQSGDHSGKAPAGGAGRLTFGDTHPEPDPPFVPETTFVATPSKDDPDPVGPILEQRSLGFCVPPNETLLGYWDRVEDRLFKIRNCMNIEGVVRQLPLWQPRIDPLLLVRAKAAGLDIDQVLQLLYEPPPRHRFRIPLEKARQFTGTAQQFGAQLLSALERKDEQELALLRSLHEDTIVNLMRRQKQDAIDGARHELDHIGETKKVIELRRDYYKGLIEDAAADPELGLNVEEDKAQENFAKAKEKNDTAAKREDKAAQIREYGPQWSVTATYGGGWNWGEPGQVATVVATGSYGSANVDERYL
jgi:hypothetical protein